MQTSAERPVRIGLVGAGFMARVHSVAYGALGAVYGDQLMPVERVRIAATSAETARAAAARFGWKGATGDWREITRADHIDLVDVAVPTHLHADIAVDALQNGKHVLCEKPLAHTLEHARRMQTAASETDTVAQVGFMFRKWPAMALARRLIDEGRLGRILHFRGHYFHDYALDPGLRPSWRLRSATAGAGSIGDIGCHLIDLARHLVGEVSSVLARSRTFYPHRPLDGSASPEPIDVDDATDLLLEFEGGATGLLQTNWMAAGYKTDLSFEVWGEEGSLRFTWRRNGELQFYAHGEPPETGGFRPVIIGPEHRGAEAFWPVAGKGLGYGDGFLIQARDLLAAIAEHRPAEPSFLDGLRACEVVAAARRSAESESWMEVHPEPALT